MTNKTPDTREDAVSKLPALHVMMVMGWQYLSPAHALEMRGIGAGGAADRCAAGSAAEPPVRVQGQELPALGRGGRETTTPRRGCKSYPLSDGGVDQIIREGSGTGMNEGLIPANEAIYKKLTLGMAVREVIDGKPTNVTVPLIDWADVSANIFHGTEELSVERPEGMGRYRPDVVGYVNGIPLVVIKAKQPVSSTRDNYSQDLVWRDSPQFRL